MVWYSYWCRGSHSRTGLVTIGFSIYQADKDGAHDAIHTRTIKRPACGAWADAETTCRAAPSPSLRWAAMKRTISKTSATRPWSGANAIVFQRPGGQPTERILQAADEAASKDSHPEQASLAFICKRLRLNFKKLSAEKRSGWKTCREIGPAEKSKPAAGEKVREWQISFCTYKTVLYDND